MTCIILMVLAPPPFFSMAQGNKKIDSLMTLLPKHGMDALLLFQNIIDELQVVAAPDRMDYARNIINRIDSASSDMTPEAGVAAGYFKALMFSDVLNIKPPAVKILSDASKIAEEIKSDFLLYLCTTQLAHASWHVYNYSEAIRIGNTAIKLEQKFDSASVKRYAGFTFVQAMGLRGMIGASHLALKQYDSAMLYYKQGIKLTTGHSKAHEFWHKFFTSATGWVYRAQGLPAMALPLEKGTLQNAVNNQDWKLACEGAIGVSVLSTQLGNLHEAEVYLDSAEKLLRHTPYRLEYLKVSIDDARSLLEAARGNYKSAYELSRRFAERQKELTLRQQADNVARLQAGFDFDHSRREISRLNLENNIKEQRIEFQWLLFTAAMLVLLLAGAGIINFIMSLRRQKKINRIIEGQHDQIIIKNQRLESQKTEIESAMSDLKIAQDQLIRNEKMAFLGKLTSGVAHEINTPLGAIKASSENSEVSINYILTGVKEIFFGLSHENTLLISDLIEFGSSPRPHKESKEKRALKKKFISELNNTGIKNEESLAGHLIELGLTADYEKWRPLLQLPNALQVFEFVAEAASLKKQNINIGLAVGKASKILFALKKYSHQAAFGERVKVDVVENIETVLSIYSHNLRSIELVRNFERVSPIYGQPDELNQVWTNLIYNSIQAMNAEGHLWITVSQSGSEIAIEIKDSGTGISPENHKRVFEPFFTTKPSGEGTGLGLSIVKKIVDEHEGRIEFKSEWMKGTTFRVFLPVAPLEEVSEQMR